jgi:chemotaxis protein MotB
MISAKPFVIVTCLLCVLSYLVGCVPAVAYDDLLQKHRKTIVINEGLQTKIEDARVKHEAWTAEKRKLDAELNYYRQLAQAGQETIEKLKALDASIMRGAQGVGLQISAPTEAGEGEITVSEGKIRILGEVLFRPGSHELSQTGRQTIGKVAEMLRREEFAGYIIRVDGHTDNQPVRRTKDKYGNNWILGAWRAYSVLSLLIAREIPESRIFLASFGENTPPRSVDVSQLSSAPVRRKCRRVEIALVASK